MLVLVAVKTVMLMKVSCFSPFLVYVSVIELSTLCSLVYISCGLFVLRDLAVMAIYLHVSISSC